MRLIETNGAKLQTKIKLPRQLIIINRVAITTKYTIGAKPQNNNIAIAMFLIKQWPDNRHVTARCRTLII